VSSSITLIISHKFCGAWCKRKLQTQEQRDAKARYYRDKTKDLQLYEALQKIVGPFITVERLEEVAYGMDTQINKSFNNTASWYAPKNKLYCGLQSLTNRLSLAVSINTIGLAHYFVRLFKMLKIAVQPSITHFLEFRDNTRAK
jgi:hypothetical protein